MAKGLLPAELRCDHALKVWEYVSSMSEPSMHDAVKATCLRAPPPAMSGSYHGTMTCAENRAAVLKVGMNRQSEMRARPMHTDVDVRYAPALKVQEGGWLAPIQQWHPC